MKKVLTVFVTLVFLAQNVVMAAEFITVPDGTPIKLRILQSISSKESKVDDKITFEVIDDVKVNDLVVLKQGATAAGFITEAEPRKRMGRKGKLAFSFDYVTAPDGQKVKIRANVNKEGDSDVNTVVITTAVAAVLLWPAAPFFLLRRGKDIGVVKGTEFNTFLDGNAKIRVSPEASVASGTTSQTPTASSPGEVSVDKETAPKAGEVLTNEGLLKLFKLGLSDDTLILKIKTSATDFDTSIDALAVLKNAGASDSVIKAVLGKDAEKRRK